MGSSDTDLDPSLRTCDLSQMHAWADFTLVGVEGDGGSNGGLGREIAVGDIDEDGLADLALATSGENVYVVLGATLAKYAPGSTCAAADIADYTLVRKANGLSGREGYPTFSGTVEISPGAVYLSNPGPNDDTRMSGFGITWPTLRALGPVPQRADEVADTAFVSPDGYAGQSMRACDLDGDGVEDVVLGGLAGHVDGQVGYLLWGPAPLGSVDLATSGVPMYYAATPGQGSCHVGACADVNGDDISDLTLSCVEPGEEQPVLNLYYGGPRLREFSRFPSASQV